MLASIGHAGAGEPSHPTATRTPGASSSAQSCECVGPSAAAGAPARTDALFSSAAAALEISDDFKTQLPVFFWGGGRWSTQLRICNESAFAVYVAEEYEL